LGNQDLACEMETVSNRAHMEYRQLGRTGLAVSILGFGTATFGGAYGPFDPAEAKRAVHLAIDEGINFFDSSPYYGITLSEERLGDALYGKRQKVILSTKCGRYGLADFDFSAKRIAASIDESLKRMKTDYLDLFLVHDVEFGDFRQIVDETIPAVRRIQQQGKARFVGVTGYPLKMLMRIALQTPVDSILSYCHCNLLCNDMDLELTPFARSNGIGLINASGLHMGILTERGAPDWHPAPANVKEAGRKAAEICRRHNRDISRVAVRFCLDHPSVSTTLVGMSNEDEVKSNLQLLREHSDPHLLEEIRLAISPALNVVWPSGKPENND
jgi:L-galactose dehydrogenase